MRKNIQSDNYEVEIRAFIEKRQLPSLIKKLKTIGAVLESEKLIKDVYYCPKNVNSIQEVEMNKVGSYSLRIREEIKGRKKSAKINVKVITQYGDHNAWKEYETVISSPKEAKFIIKSIGFKPFFRVNKKRETFSLGRINLSIEKIKDLGIVLEAEIITSKMKINQSKRKILSLFKKLGIDNSQIIPKSATNLLMKKKASF